MSTYDKEYERRLERQVRSLQKQLDATRYIVEQNTKFRVALLSFVQNPPKMSLEAAIKQAKTVLKG